MTDGGTAIPYLETLAAMVHGISPERLPATVKERVEAVVLDFLAALAAGRSTPTGRVFSTLAGRLGPEGQATILAQGVRANVLLAAAANAAAAHAVELDDVHADATGFHPGVTVIPAVLAVGEVRHLPGSEVLAGILAGYEVGGRIGAAMTPSHRYRGFHATGTVGTLAAAAGAAQALGLSPEKLASALGLAASMAGGTFAILSGGTEAKHLHAAHAVLAGLWAAFLAEAGLEGPHAALEASEGFFHAYADEVNADRLLRPLGEPWEIEQLLVKPYPCCAHAFGAVDLAAELADRIAAGAVKAIETIEVIDAIEVETYRAAAVLANRDPQTPLEAKFSIPYCVAATLTTGSLNLDSFEPAELKRKDVRALAQKVRITEDPEATSLFPFNRRTILRIQLANQRILEAVTDVPRGMPGNPLSITEVLEKFRSLAGPALGSMTGAVEEHVSRLMETSDWANGLVHLLTAGRSVKGVRRSER